MLPSSIRKMAKHALDASGWYVKRFENVPTGVNWAWDLKRLFPEPLRGVMLDVGANIGQTTRFLSREFPTSKIFAFEPIPESFELLRRNTSQLGNVSLHEVAMSDTEGTREIPTVGSAPTNSLTTQKLASDPKAKMTKIAMTTLDKFCSEEHIERIAVLKTDTEGHDTNVLRGASRLLTSERIDVVVSEVTFDEQNSLQTPFRALHEILFPSGFVLCSLYETETLQRCSVDGTYCNAMFIRRALLPHRQ